MLKPLELPWRVRLWQFIRGVLFYNTVYWKRASDDLNPPSLSREERLNAQPARNLEIIRPREHPRAKIVAARGAQISLPVVGLMPASEPDSAEPVSEVLESVPEIIEPPVEPDPVAAPPPAEATGPEVVIRRRRYRRRHNKVRPSQVGTDPTLHAKASYFGWLFTGKKRQ